MRTLAARNAVPVHLHVDLPTRPTPGVEAIAYFSVAELLNNVVKHAQASVAGVRVVTTGPNLSITARDNGTGGADPQAGSGLAGLADRGPTVVSIELPMAGTR